MIQRRKDRSLGYYLDQSYSSVSHKVKESAHHNNIVRINEYEVLANVHYSYLNMAIEMYLSL